MSWALNDPACAITVTGTLFHDPVRGESLEVVLALRSVSLPNIVPNFVLSSHPDADHPPPARTNVESPSASEHIQGRSHQT